VSEEIYHNPNYEVIESDFIMVVNDFMPEGYCQKAIEDFEMMLDHGFGHNRQDREKVNTLQKNDEHSFSLEFLSPQENDVETIKRLGPIQNQLSHALGHSVKLYQSIYGVIQTLAPLYIPEIKWQKTRPSGGYHLWHCEAGDSNSSDRVLAYTYYLNTVEQGGETEFLYQQKRITAVENTLCIFPAGFTHTHRGNPPLSGNKYIATGWIEF
jgi:hypothetical protein